MPLRTSTITSTVEKEREKDKVPTAAKKQGLQRRRLRVREMLQKIPGNERGRKGRPQESSLGDVQPYVMRLRPRS